MFTDLLFIIAFIYYSLKLVHLLLNFSIVIY